MSTRIPELTSFLRELQLEQYAEDANKWCEDMGAAFFQEIWEERQELAEALNLKPLEKKRLLGERGIEAFRSRLPPNVFTFTSMSAPGAPPSPSHAMSEQRAPRVIMEPVTSSSSSKPSTTRFVPRILQSVGPRCHSCQNPIASGDQCSACLAAAHQRRSSFSDGNRCRWCQIPIAGGEFCYPCSGVTYQQHQNQPEDHQIWRHSNVDYCDTGVQPPASATTESMTTAAHVYTHSDDNPGDMGSAASYATASSSENGICTPPDVDALLSDSARRRAHENVQISRGDAGTGASGDVFLQDFILRL